MGQTVGFRNILRGLAVIDEGCVKGQAGLVPGPAEGSSLDPKTAALLRVGATAAIGASPACLEWTTGRALAAGASEDEIADVLLAIAPVTGLGRIVSAAPEMAAALGFDIQAALEETRWPVTRLIRTSTGQRRAHHQQFPALSRSRPVRPRPGCPAEFSRMPSDYYVG